MSQPDFLERLLDGAGTTWVPLGKTLIRTKGTKITARQMKSLHKEDAPLKIFAGGKTFADVDFDDIPANDVNRAPSIIVKSRGFIEFEYYDKPFSHKNEMWSYYSGNENIDIKYVYHFLKMKEPYFQGLGRKMQMPQISTPDTDKFKIPIPCPENPKKSRAIQTEIVRILDTFTALTAELTAELTARKKQYNYYRNQLLTFSDDAVAWVPLGKIFNLKNGYTPSKSEKNFWKNGYVPWFRMDDIRQNGQILDDSLQKISKCAVKGGKLFPADSIIIATSATIGEHALITVPYLANQRFTNLSLKEKYVAKFDIKFLFYYCFLLGEWCKKNTTMSSFASVDMDGFRKFKIPIPYPDDTKKSLEIQAEIVRILDKFDTLTHSISEGLPSEIELRQKQYEYYRDLLLNFPKPEGAT